MIPIYVVNHGWHTGLVIPNAEISEGLIPENGVFRSFDFLEIGWGDRDYYMSSDPGFWLGIKAVFWINPSVLHVVAFTGSPKDNFPYSSVLRVDLSEEGFERLTEFIHKSFDRSENESAHSLGAGLYGVSRFFPSKENFHLFHVCNQWTAAALRAAGVPISSWRSFTAGGVMSQVEAVAANSL